MSDGTKAPRFPPPRDRDPYREAPPRTFASTPRAPVLVTRAEEPTLDVPVVPREREVVRRPVTWTDRAHVSFVLAVVVGVELVGIAWAQRVPRGGARNAAEFAAVIFALFIGALVARRIHRLRTRHGRRAP
jgi:hypothetical protein